MINRLKDIAAIERYRHQYDDKSMMLILYARKGVGKSYLVDHVFLQNSATNFIRCSINQQEAEESKGLYISSLIKALDKYAKETASFMTVQGFIENIYSIDKNREKTLNDLLDIAAELTRLKVVKEKLDKSKKFKEELIAKILQTDSDIAVSFLLEYIEFVARDNRIVISIENIQLATRPLISFLNEVLKKTKTLFLIGEYTINESEKELTGLFAQFPFVLTEVYELKKLSKQELIGGIRKEFDSEIVEDIYEIIENSYDDSYGNLVELELLLKKNRWEWNLSPEKSLAGIKYDNTVHAMYSQLTNDQRMALWQIVSHLGRVHTIAYGRLLEHSSVIGRDLMTTHNALSGMGLLKIANGYISVAHDRIYELLKQEDDYKKFIAIANQNWLDFYRSVTIRSDIEELRMLNITRQELLIFQLTLILSIGGTTNVDWMNAILSELNENISNTVSNSLIPKLASIFSQVIETNANRDLVRKTYHWIVLILSKTGHSEEISEIFNKYKRNYSSDLIFLLESAARVATCDPGVNKELELINNTDSPYLYIGSQLLLLRYYRTFNQIKKARAIWNDLKDSNEYTSTPYRGIISDQINLCSFNFRERQELLRISEHSHKKSENHYHYCASLLNLTANSYYLYFLRRMGRAQFLKIASENLDKAKDILSHSHYPMHAYQNQKTIFQLVSGNVPTSVLQDNFKSAYLNCGIAGNRPLIGSNIIAMGLKENDLAGVQEYVDDLMVLSRRYHELNSEFSKYPLINCYNYFQKVGDKKGRKEAMSLLRKGKIFNNLGDLLVMTPVLPELILRKIRYYPCNIFNWDIDFESIYKRF